jgi:hypothetical protein
MVFPAAIQPTSIQANSMAGTMPSEGEGTYGFHETTSGPDSQAVVARVVGDSTVIYLVDLHSGEERQLAQEPFETLPLPMFERFITLSADGRLVAYVTADDLGMSNSRLWLVATETTERQLLAAFVDDLWIAPLVWSSDSTHLALVKTSTTAASGVELWILNVSSREQTLIVSDASFRPELFYGAPLQVVRWSPDGNSIVYTDYVHEEGVRIEYEVDLVSRGIRQSRHPLTTEEQEQLSILAALPCSVTPYSQNDPSWQNDVMRTCGLTIGTAGCALTSTAMVFCYYDAATNPKTLNNCLGTCACDLCWGTAASSCSGGKATWKDFIDFSWSAMQTELSAGRPPILKLTKTWDHWVVVIAGSGSSVSGYTILDPADGQVKSLSAYSAWTRVRLARYGGGAFCTSGSRPTLASPGNGASTCDTTPYFDWSSVSGATSYRIQVDNSSGFGSPAINKTTSGSSYTPTSALSPGKYYWRVRAINSCGERRWSSTWSFTILAAPSGTSLSSPANGSSTCDTTPTFSWSSVSGATSYRIQVSTSSAFSTLEINQTTSSTSYTPGSPLPAGTHYWRVRASNTCGDGPWSSAWSVIIVALPSAPNLLSPDNGSSTSDDTPTFTWSSVSGATSYSIQVSTSSTFTTLEINETTSDTSYTPGSPLPAGTHYWRVRASNTCGDGPWSSTWSVIVVAPSYTSYIPLVLKGY